MQIHTLIKTHTIYNITTISIEFNYMMAYTNIYSVAMKPLSYVRYGVQEALALARHDSTLSSSSRGSSKDKKNAQASRYDTEF